LPDVELAPVPAAARIPPKGQDQTRLATHPLSEAIVIDDDALRCESPHDGVVARAKAI
jgi:hypothetical protein